jgi:signal transduction histidine kinase
MGFINLAEKTINAKLVYYGVGVGGKTTSLQAVHKVMCPRNEVQLVSINTEEDSTLLFDFLPIDLGQVEGFKIRIQGFTVPGQPKYKLMRKYVLSGADAVVFVVDSQRSRLEENLQSLEGLFTNLKLNGLDPSKIPVVLQYNKRDLDDILGEDELDERFRQRPDMASFPSVATDGQGVFETFVHAAGLLIEAKVRLYKLNKGGSDAHAVAESVRTKLWELHTLARGPGDRPAPANLSVRVPDVAQAAPAAESSSTDLDLDLPLAADVDFAIDESPDPAEEQAGLLDRVVQSNLELARRYGELDEYRTQLERKNHELVKVTQDTAHDLGKPLTAVMTFLKGAQKGMLGEVEGPLKDALGSCLDALSMMDRMVRDLGLSSRLDYDGIKLEFVDLDPVMLATRVLHTLRHEIEDKGANVIIERMPRLKADEWGLTKVFLNLIANALQYAADDRRPSVRISCTARDDRFVIGVQDNGIGIPEADLPSLFKRFQRGSNVREIPGTGLGLHIVREMILGHGGEVWVESQLGKGTSFYLALPKQPVQPAHSAVSSVLEAEPPPAEPVPLPGAR